MAGVFGIPKLTLRTKNFNPEVPTFTWDDFSRKEDLGSGSFGAVYSGRYDECDDDVVVKELRVQNRESKRLFLKEARLLHKIKGHENIGSFIAFCAEPYAIMMEYLYFDFHIFGVDKKVTSLSSLLHFVDDQLDFTALKKFQAQIARDIAHGLCYLHDNGIVHRDLKPENVLVTNQHYAGEMDESIRNAQFAENPVRCKLADFGESRATYLQTQTLLESQTHRVNRGTPVYMAPEAHSLSPMAASHDDLKKADIWSFGLIMYCLLNPDVDHPYQHVFAEAGVPESIDSLKHLLKKKRLPKQQPKYEFLQVSEWYQIEEAFNACVIFEPELRPSASILSSMLSVNEPEASLNLVNLVVSQATALSEVDRKLAESFDKRGVDEFHPVTLPENDGTNACVFLSLAICNRFLATQHSLEWAELKTVAEKIITEFPIVINPLRNIENTYEPISAYSLMKNNNLIGNCALSEEFVELETHAVFSVSGRNHFASVLSAQARTTSSAIGLYTCDPYTFLVGVHRDALFVMDTHQINETVGGNGNGILVYTGDKSEKSCKLLVQWILKRLVQSGVAADGHQSLAWVTYGDISGNTSVLERVVTTSPDSATESGNVDNNPTDQSHDDNNRSMHHSAGRDLAESNDGHNGDDENGANNCGDAIDADVGDGGISCDNSNREDRSVTIQYEVIDLTDMEESDNSSETNDVHPNAEMERALNENRSIRYPDLVAVKSEGDATSTRSSNADVEQVEYYHNNTQLPVYTKERKVLKPQEVMELLIREKDFLDSKVCTAQPLQVEHHRTFIVDINSLLNANDIKCDDMGVWLNNSSHKFYFKVSNDDETSVVVISATNTKAGQNTVILKREYFSLKHDIHKDVRKRIDTIILSDNDLYRYCLVQYYFKDGKEHPIDHWQHGNSKRNDKEYVRTWESTKVYLEKASQSKSPRDAVHHVIADNLGGVGACDGVGQIPRNRQQSSDLKRNRRNEETPVPVQPKNISGKGKVDDPWYLLLTESKKQTKDKRTAFVRDVRVGGEPLCVLSSNRQLNDLKRFCCSETEFKPFTVDPTFNIGQFNVTPISYQHLLLETVKERKHPTLIGPVLIHERKTEQTYSTFASSLKALEPGLATLMAFGTDDEKALENGFNNNFERATHLLCEIHLKKNVANKLVELGITGCIKEDIVSDVFGRQNGDIFESGLSDSANQEEFDHQLGVLEKKWSDAHDKGADFYDWFLVNKATEFLSSVISPVRQRAGLGNPPERFTTNRSERTNGVIQEFVKRECRGKKVDEYVFSVTLRKLIVMQEKELELAVVGQGEYRLRDNFMHIYVPPSRWTKMTSKQMETALQQVHSVTVEERSSSSNVPAVSQALQENENPLLQIFTKAGIDWIPRNVLDLMIAKASRLEGKMHVLPSETLQTVIVPSSSNPKKPHVVVFLANGKCECQDCPGYSATFVCAHTIAASVKLNRLEAYLKWLVTTKRKTGGINYSKAVTYGMPTGRGRKPNQPPRKRSKAKHPSRDKVTVVPRIQPQYQPQDNATDERVSACSLPPIQPSRFIAHPHTALGAASQPPINTHMPSNTPPSYPSPQPNTFIIYLLNLCPPLTSSCHGCKGTLKPGGCIGSPPADLVIVSNMVRTWTREGQLQGRPGNVYFHCFVTCVQHREPRFQPCHLSIPRQIAPYLRDEHWRFIQQTLGNLAIC